MKLIDEQMAEDELCLNRHSVYEMFVNQRMRMLNVKDSVSKHLTTYYRGRLDAEFVLVGLNPGSDGGKRDDIVEIEARKDHIRFLDDCHIHQLRPGPFYTPHAKLICGIIGVKEIWDYLGKNLLVLELVGERSKTFNLDIEKLSREARCFIDGRFDNILEAITSYKRRLVIFSGKVFVRLLADKGYLKGAQIKEISKNKDGESLNAYKFKINGIDCILFDRFLPRGYCYGMKDKDLYETIPDFIRQRYGL